MATPSIRINIPVPTLSAAEQSELKRAFDAQIVRTLKKHRPAGSAITNWGGSCSTRSTPIPGKKKAAKKKAAKKPAKKAAKKKK